jgi:hypothetical protein
MERTEFEFSQAILLGEVAMDNLAERLTSIAIKNFLKTKLSATEIRFLEQRIPEERITLATLQCISSNNQSTIKLPDAL